MRNAEELFKEGYNCSQAVFCAYCEEFGIDFETGLKLSSSFGGGMGKLREVCGACSAMFMLLGLKKGYSTLDDIAKKEHYERVQHLANLFKEDFGSIICRELLELDEKVSAPIPTKRNDEFYKTRPCVKFVRFAAELVEKEVLK